MQDHTGSASGSGDPDPPPPDRAYTGGEGGSSATARLPSRNASSKYDFVKVFDLSYMSSQEGLAQLSGKQLLQWPVEEVEKLRGKPVNVGDKIVKPVQ